MKKTVAHFLDEGIKPNQEFVYNQISQLKKYRSIVIGPFPKKENFYSFSEFYDLNKIKHFQDFIKEQNVVAIHAHHGGQALKILPQIKAFKIPFIVSFRGRDGSAQGSAYTRNFNRYEELKQLGTMYFPVCDYIANDMKKLGFPKSRIHVLYGGINLEKFPYIQHKLSKDGEIRILSVGRLEMKKGFDTLIKAFAKLHKNNPTTTLHIIGDGSNKKKLESLIKKQKLNHVVKLRGQMSAEQIVTEMTHAHLFCLASQTAKDGDVEGIPNALKEAMACGIPVVSTQNGGIPELIKHKETGYLAEEKNASSLAAGFQFYLDNPDIWQDYTRKARQTIEENFDINKQIGVQERLYDKLWRH
ncbi:colanic acid biosynthesis glycosyltransferase WcaL [Salipaludibacillus keqinensis]|uniref:Colanic acid biosynthesis glycosyltransferase WcaL n=1 Tax=Salipaludibacillus keqinensis TaxID=2045207 RepID=A0A323TQ77_9BACI|nr:glycosyltransferase [Salipaludibacillus keqinensis]PYZ94673.1 colanic acid biosynthesis glycosyltransferase WcaL [Salipaludibacillus keqinensis]